MYRQQHLRHFSGPSEGGRGFGGWFADGGELGGRGFGMGRKLASTDLKLLILKLLADKPRHGYEIIRALDERSKGFYVPSPGMVYPALTCLEEAALATIAIDGTRKLYRITEVGQQYLKERRAAADALLRQFERVGERMERLRRAMRSDDSPALEPLEEDASGRARPLMRASRALKTALAEKWRSSPEEQDRIAEILRRAAAEIGGKLPCG